MNYRLLLVDGHGEAITSQLRIRMLREFPGVDALSVHFRPVRNDLLFDSAKIGGQIAYRILRGEGIVRSQLWIEYEVLGENVNVMGRSSDLLFALALIASKWTLGTGERYQTIAATGVLLDDGSVQSVEHTAQKIAAAVRDLAVEETANSSVIFYPAADAASVASWLATAALPGHIELRPVAHLEDALGCLGYSLQKVYLRNPFRGLEHFDFEDHAIFFGRDAEVRDVLQQLLRRERAGLPGLLVEGASGSGKSSFLRAGVLPALVDPRFQSEPVRVALTEPAMDATVRRAIWRPGLLPPGADERTLALSIRDCWANLPEFGDGWLNDAPDKLEDLALARLAHWPTNRRFVWLIDQFEELFALGMSDAQIEAFARFLSTLQSQGVWILASVRADAMPQLKRHQLLRDVFGANEGQYYLAAMSGTALDAVISLPAKAAGLTFEVGADGRSLDQLLREDAYREKDSLPLLQFTLNELYQKRLGQELTLAAYHDLGGLHGSIATTAAAVLCVDGGTSQLAAPRLFRSLVSVDDAGHATRRYAPLGDLTGDPEQKRLLMRLIEARLCVTDQRDGQSVVAFAHDTLLQTLPALTEWLKQEAGLLQTRELAQRETQQWQQHGKVDDWLAAPDKLAAFKTLEDAGIMLPDSVRAFIDRSDQRVRRVRRIKQLAVALIALLTVGVVVGAIAFGLQARKAAEAREMTARRGEFLEGLLKSADPRGGSRDVTVAELLDASMKQMESMASKEPLVTASMLGLIAETDNGLGRDQQGLIANTRALELLRANNAPKSDLAEALMARGQLLEESGHYKDAEAPLREALSLLENEPGAQEQLAGSLDGLGRSLVNTGREAEGEAVLKRSIEIYKKLGDLRATAIPLANLGVLYGNLGRYAESAEAIRQAAEIQEKFLPADHPDLLGTQFNYASALENNHQFAQAEQVFRKLIAARIRVLGPDHRFTLFSEQALADTLYELHRYSEAAATALPAAQTLDRVAGEDHPYSMAAWAMYGISACLNGEGEAGLAALRKVEKGRRAKYGADDWHVFSTELYMGTCLAAMKRDAEAEPMLKQAVAALEGSRGTSFHRTQAGYQALRDLCVRAGRAPEASQWQAKILPALQ
jgi:tetratricopeptide (TPR) repeat protein